MINLLDRVPWRSATARKRGDDLPGVATAAGRALDLRTRRALNYQLLMLDSTSTVKHGQPSTSSPQQNASVNAPTLVTTRAETVVCNCPDPCERDHEFD